MTTVITPNKGPLSPVIEKIVVKSWRLPISLGIFALLAVVLFVVFGRDGWSSFQLSTETDVIQIPIFALPSRLTGAVVSGVLIGIAITSIVSGRIRRTANLWLVLGFSLIFFIGFLTWAAVGSTVPVYGIFVGTIGLGVPLIFGAMGGVISERVGVINVAIEGQLLAGAFVSALVASVTRQPFLGLFAALVAGALVAFVLAAFSIKYFVDQVIVGVVLNVLVVGLTSFLYVQVLIPNAGFLNSPSRFERISIPVLAEIPLIGPAMFRQTIIVYIMYAVVALVYLGLFHTRWGLRVRAVGEHPQAADTVGIAVNRTRFWNVLLAGAIAGLGGAYYTLGELGAFSKDMTAGYGYIALAAVIFGRWDPIRATFAALLFGFATNLQNILGVIGSPVPSEFMLMLPYLVTIFAVVSFAGQVHGPASAGKPYIKS